MRRIIPCVLGLVLSLIPSAVRSQNLPPIAINDTVYMCSTTITIYVQQNDTNPDGDSLVLSIYAGSVNGSFSVNLNAINYTPNVGFTGTDTLIYSLCDDGVPPLCDTAVVIIHVGADYLIDDTVSICSGDSIFLGGAWQNTPGSYLDWLSSQYGCDSIVTTELYVNPVPVATITTSGSLNACEVDSVTLTANTAAYYMWSTGDTTQSIVVYSPGTYSVYVTDLNSCSSIEDSVTINIIPAPNATITPSGSTTLCQGDVITLLASSGDSYIWSTGATTQSISVNSTGSFTVIITNGTCIDTASVNVTVNPAPTATVTPGGPTSFCSGDSVQLTASAGGSWLWSTGDTTQSITVVSSGNYWVIVTIGSCSDTSATTTVTVTPTPVATITPSGTTTLCQGDQVTLTASNGQTYLWSTGATTQSITVNTAGSYWVIVSNGSCSDTSATINVTVSPAPTATITPAGPITFCSGDTVLLTASAGGSWLWSTGATTQSITVENSGNYYVIVTIGSCSDTSASVSVTVTPTPVATITPSGPTTICQGDALTLTASAGATWLWSTGATTQAINVVTTGNYWVIVSNGSGCSDTSAVTSVIVNPLPVAIVTANGPTTFCEGDSVTLTSGTGTSWLWSNGATSQSIVVTDGGLYSVTVTDANGCSATSSGTGVTVNEEPQAGITASGATDLCIGDSVTLTSVSGTSWLWSNGATTQSITVGSAGSYYVIATNQCGSDTSSAVAVTVTNNPPVASIGSAQTGFTVTFTDNSTGATTWSWNFGDNAMSSEQHPVHEYTAPGTYQVVLIVTNACGSDTTSIVIDIDNPETLGLYNSFSPNGDGFNDTWTVPLLDYYSDNTVTIVNRWGSEVWKATDYNNDTVVWAGQNLSGDNLPDGTYYYIITYSGQESRGWVFIKR